MWWLLILGLGGLGAMTVIGSRDSKKLEAGKKYRFTVKVTPGFDLDNLNSFVATLTAQGAVNVDTSQGSDATTVIYTMTNVTAKEVFIGKPLFAFEEHTVSFTSIEEVK